MRGAAHVHSSAHVAERSTTAAAARAFEVHQDTPHGLGWRGNVDRGVDSHGCGVASEARRVLRRAYRTQARPARAASSAAQRPPRSGGMAYLPLAPYDEGDALQALLCGGSDCDGDEALSLFSWGADAPPPDARAGAAFRCLEPEHGAACTRCAGGGGGTSAEPRALRGCNRERNLRGAPARSRVPRRRCTPPPPVADAARYELVGDAGKARSSLAPR